MIIKLKNADFSANNVGRISLPGGNLNIGEGTNNPLLFKYSNTTGNGEFLGVDFVSKNNPSPFSIIRKLHKGGTGTNLYSFLTADRTTINFPQTPSNISMAIWLNISAWEQFQSAGALAFTPQVYVSNWVSIGSIYLRYSDIASDSEHTGTLSSSYINGNYKWKVLDRQTVNGDSWICLGIVFYELTYNTENYEANCRPRIAFTFGFMNSADHYMEAGNFQVVESADYLNPTEEY